MLIVSGRTMTYMAYASSIQADQGVPISGVQIKGNDIMPSDSIRANLANAGFRTGSYIKGDTLVTSKRSLTLNDAISNAEQAVTMTTIPGTKLTPIVAADVKVDKQTGIVTVNVIENFNNLAVNGSAATQSAVG